MLPTGEKSEERGGGHFLGKALCYEQQRPFSLLERCHLLECVN